MPSLTRTITVGTVLALTSCVPTTQADNPNPNSVDVVDGDTIDLNGSRIRIIGINTPETDECGATQAAHALTTILDNAVDIDLVTDTTNTDQYGRLLRYIHADSVDVGAELITQGWAIARSYPPDTSRDDHYHDLQTIAQNNHAGIWQPDLCGTTQPIDISIEVVADPPGPDLDNLNAETITLTNNTTKPIDLTNWTIADESSSHRYQFPTGSVIAPDATLTLHTGCGTPTPTDHYWCATGSAIWNNNGDTAYLKDPNGNIAVTQPVT